MSIRILAKRAVSGGLVLIVFFLLFYWESVLYGFSQAKGQLRIVWNTKALSEVLESGTLTDEQRSKMMFIQLVKEFAEDSLGFKKSANYSTYFDQKGQAVLWVVTAAPPFEMAAYEWKFPIVGRFSYKGFFDLQKAKREEEKLKSAGYDTRINEVSAWSTLGYFKDPVLSSMLERNYGYLAELIIHELTHHNLYIKDSVGFNENLASFIGNEGAKKFLLYYEKDSSVYKSYLAQKRDAMVFNRFMIQAAHELDSLYRAFDKDMTLEEKYNKRAEAYENIVLQLRKLSFETERYADRNLDATQLNNAYFLSFMRYHQGEDELRWLFEHEFDENIRVFFDYFKSHYSSI